MPLISVIVPVYDVEKYIYRCVDSILTQTFSDFELILVDDGSPDQSGDICDKYAEKDYRVIVIHQENGGLSAARNAGIDRAFAHSDSEWLTFIDSDDWVHPKYLESLINAAIYENADLAIGEYTRTKGECDNDLDVDEPVYVDAESFYCEHHVTATVAWGKLYKKEFFKQLRYPVGKIHEDEYVTYKILFSAKKIVYTKSHLYFYCENENGITGKQWTVKRLDALGGFKEQVRYFSKNKKRKAYSFALNNYIEHLVFGLYQLDHLLPEKKWLMFMLCFELKYIAIFNGLKSVRPELVKEIEKRAFPILKKIRKTVNSVIQRVRLWSVL